MSRQTSSVLYTSTTPRPARALPAIAVATGKRLVVQLPVPSEGRVLRLYVGQETGTAVAFATELLFSAVPYGDGSGAAAAHDAVLAAPAGPYRVVPRQTALAAAAIDWRTQDSASGGMGHAFVNVDQASRSVPNLFLYLVIIPTAAGGATTWVVHLLTDQPTS